MIRAKASFRHSNKNSVPPRGSNSFKMDLTLLHGLRVLIDSLSTYIDGWTAITLPRIFYCIRGFTEFRLVTAFTVSLAIWNFLKETGTVSMKSNIINNRMYIEFSDFLSVICAQNIICDIPRHKNFHDRKILLKIIELIIEYIENYWNQRDTYETLRKCTYQGKGVITVSVPNDDSFLSRLTLWSYRPSRENDNIDPNEDTKLLYYRRCCHFSAKRRYMWVIFS